MVDITILTDKRFIQAVPGDTYIENVLLEDEILAKDLQAIGLSTKRTHWDDENYNWSTTKAVIFRATWDYHYQYKKFTLWLEKVNQLTRLINTKEIIDWNSNKKYLLALNQQGVPIVPSIFISNSEETLSDICKKQDWHDIVVKPAVSAGGKDTYLVNEQNIQAFSPTFKELVYKQEMMIQPFQENILNEGEITFVVIDGQYSHALLKKAKTDEFRVQDDFGGTVHPYQPSTHEIDFAEHVFKQIPLQSTPLYGRVDVIRGSKKELLVSELELIEPELWFRNNLNSSKMLAKAIKALI